jgi:nucleoside-diphosphate-sugar epimerase
MTKTVAVTGGNGRIGRVTLAHLSDSGYEAVNVARGKQREDVSDGYRTTDLLDAGEVYGSLAAAGADAVIHMGTIPDPRGNPGFRVYESNVMSTYHVLEAAAELGIESVCLASSINAMGAIYQDPPMDVRYLPVDEDHPLTPRDPYATSKHALEVTADGFGRQEGPPHTVSSLRYPWVATEEQLRDVFLEGDRTFETVGLDGGNAHDELYTYLHIEDAAEVARLAVEADFEGHEPFWAVGSDSNMETPTPELVEAAYPDVEVRDEFSGHEALVSIEKAQSLLGWSPERSWRNL